MRRTATQRRWERMEQQAAANAMVSDIMREYDRKTRIRAQRRARVIAVYRARLARKEEEKRCNMPLR